MRMDDSARSPDRRVLPQGTSPHRPSPASRSSTRAGKDVRSLALLLLLCLVQLWSQRSLLRIPQLAAATACSAGVVAALACALMHPQVYRRHRQPIVAALRVLLGVSTLLAGSSMELLASAAQPAQGRPLPQALPHFVLLLAWDSGALLLGQVRALLGLQASGFARASCCFASNDCCTAPLLPVRLGCQNACQRSTTPHTPLMPGCPLRPAHQAAWSLELPPLLAIGVQLVGVSAAASRNSSTCASPYLQRPANRLLMSHVYALLQPAVAPLEPLLATVGLTAAYPSRQCICGECGRLEALDGYVSLHGGGGAAVGVALHLMRAVLTCTALHCTPTCICLRPSP